MSSTDTFIQLTQINKHHISGSGERIQILNNISLQINRGETLAITGQSGSGKTTLLSLLGGLDTPNEGVISIDGQNLNDLSENELTRFRAANMGIIFQQFYLMKHLTALENVTLPLEILQQSNVKKRAIELLERVNLGNRINHLPAELSGGEIQRIAIARALINRPKLLLADEPTGNLDVDNGNKVANLLFDLVEQEKMTLILVTHNHQLAARCSRMQEIVKGTLHNIELNKPNK